MRAETLTPGDSRATPERAGCSVRAILVCVQVGTVETFTAVLALAAASLAGLVVVGRAVRRRVDAVDLVVSAIDDAALWLAWLIAAVAMVASLYFSESARFEPCRLCWFQRIAMYPNALILLVAAIRNDRKVVWYSAPLAAIGAVVSVYHYVIEWNPDLNAGVCGLGPSCTTVWFREFGFVTLPFMALCGFLAIIVLVVVARPAPTGSSEGSA